jgi:hypothetical protein
MPSFRGASNGSGPLGRPDDKLRYEPGNLQAANDSFGMRASTVRLRPPALAA